MSLVVDLPPPLGEDPSREAEGEHVSPAEHAQILLSLVWSLRRGHQDATSAKVIREFFRSRSLDPDLVVTAFEDLVILLLKNRCATVSIDKNYDNIAMELPPIEEIVQRIGRLRRPSARGSAAHLEVTSEDVAREHQEDIEREEKGWH